MIDVLAVVDGHVDPLSDRVALGVCLDRVELDGDRGRSRVPALELGVVAVDFEHREGALRISYEPHDRDALQGVDLHRGVAGETKVAAA